MSAHCGTCFPTMRAEFVKHLGTRWCFQCRERVGFTLYVLTDTAPMSYYEPIPVVRCSPRDHTDGDLGFGRYREAT